MPKFSPEAARRILQDQEEATLDAKVDALRDEVAELRHMVRRLLRRIRAPLREGE